MALEYERTGWLGEVAVLAHVFNRFGLQKAIEERVRFARARMGDYEVIDFVVMLMGYALSGEPTLEAWNANNRKCTKYLIPFLPTLLDVLERHGYLHLTAEGKKQLLSLSPATADWLLQASRTHHLHGISPTCWHSAQTANSHSHL